MNVLVLGAGGFIGSNLVEHFAERSEHDVVGIDLSRDKLAGIRSPGFRFVRADITRTPRAVERAVKAADVVIDLVAYANPSLYTTAPLDVIRTNFTANAWIVETCVRHGARLIQFSTSEVYGKATSETYVEDETDLRLGPVTRSRWVYASSKQLLERVIHAHGEAGDLEYTILRPFNLIGPRFDYLVPPGTTGGPRVFAHFMSALLSDGPMYLVDGGQQRRAFTHVEDALAFVELLLHHPGARNEIFNVGNPANDISIRDLALLMLRSYEALTGTAADCDLVEIPGIDFYGPGYEDTSRVPPDVTKARSLGWEPQHDLESTILRSMEATLAAERDSKSGLLTRIVSAVNLQR